MAMVLTFPLYRARQRRSGLAQQSSPVVLFAFPRLRTSPSSPESKLLAAFTAGGRPHLSLSQSPHYQHPATYRHVSMVASSASSLASSRRGMTAARAAPIGVAYGALLASYLLLQTDDAKEDDTEQQPQQQQPLALINHLLRPMPADCFFFKNKSSNQDTGTPTTPTSTANIVINPAPFESVYKLGPKLGTGAFATVYKCTLKSKPKRAAACKVFDLSKVPPEKQARIREGIREVRMREGRREGGKKKQT